MPFRLPYPFVKATQTQAAVILRPTSGDFLNDYNNNTDLHIAVTTSQGMIVEFDSHGLRTHDVNVETKKSWRQCLVVETIPEAWHEFWDEVLIKTSELPAWTAESYDKDTHNCYSFVLTFLQTVGFGDLSRVASNRTLFCERFICPRTVVAGKYISLYRKIRDQGRYIHLTQNKTTTGKASSSEKTNKHTMVLQP